MIRIDPKQKEWLRKHKVCRTLAGQLDIILNDYKKRYGPSNKKQQLSNLRNARTEGKPLGVRALQDESVADRIQSVAD